MKTRSGQVYNSSRGEKEKVKCNMYVLIEQGKGGLSRRLLKKDRMEHLSCYIPRKHIEELDELVKRGVYPSRSEAIRDAISRLLWTYGEESLVKVVCDCCDGDGYIVRRKHPTGEEVKVRCPCCDGLGYDYEVEWKEREK